MQRDLLLIGEMIDAAEQAVRLVDGVDLADPVGVSRTSESGTRSRLDGVGQDLPVGRGELFWPHLLDSRDQDRPGLRGL